MKYVQCCQGNLWYLKLRPKNWGDEINVPFRCRSWRHQGECCLWKGAQDWCRIRDAVKKREDWVYIVLTYDPKEWNDWREQYKRSCPIWGKLLKRMTRQYGYVQYIQTWERHKKGGLHVNVLAGNDDIRRECEKDWRDWRRFWLEPNAIECGYGKRTWVEMFRKGTAESMAGYLGKLARELVGADSKGQIPYDAPAHFRRLRASRGLLPPIMKGDYTGELVMSPLPGATHGYWIDGEVPDEGPLTK